MGACVRARVCVFVSFFSLVFFFRNFYFVWKRKKFFNKKFKKKKKKNVALAFTSSCYCVRGTRTQPLISVGCSVLLISENLRFRLCPHTFASLWGACLRFASLWRTNSHGDSCVLGVHLSNVCWAGLHSVFVKRLSFKSLLKLRKAYIFQEFAEVYYRSVFAESFKAYILPANASAVVVPQSMINLPRCEARRHHFIMTWNIFGTERTNILGLCYLFGKTYKQTSVAPLK